MRFESQIGRLEELAQALPASATRTREQEVALRERIVAAEIQSFHALAAGFAHQGDWRALVRKQMAPPASAERYIRNREQQLAEWPQRRAELLQTLREFTGDDNAAWAARLARMELPGC